VLEILLPVPADGALDMAPGVGAGVDVDLDQTMAMVGPMIGDPLRGDESVGIGETVFRHWIHSS